MPLLRTVCCCWLILASWQCAAADAPLAWKFNAGEEHHYRLTQNMAMNMTLGETGRKVETNIKQVLDMNWKIKSVDDQGDATIVLKIDRAQLDIQAPGQPELHYDTAAKKSPTGFAATLVPLFKAMAKEPFTMTFSPRGEVKDMILPGTFMKAMNGIPGAKMMGQIFSRTDFQRMVQNSSPILPKQNDLAEGSEWDSKATLLNPQLGQLDAYTTYRYLGPREVKDRQLEAFAVAMKLEFETEPESAKLKVTKDDSQGEFFFDRTAGHLASSNLKQEFELEITTDIQTVNQTMTQTFLFERIEAPFGQAEDLEK